VNEDQDSVHEKFVTTDKFVGSGTMASTLVLESEFPNPIYNRLCSAEHG